MLGTTTRLACAALGAAFVLGGAGTAVAAPHGPCRDVPYVGVCEPLRGTPQTPQRQSRGEVGLPGSAAFESYN
ncbi:hypothetical protein [Mycolicibacterium phlei]|uniref:hypothetical protein n=1 Tax=Mycolicibacterium phlei TaxID=1771 RepID=UPI000305C805|nr:hypothetical protein [Mycolicibacterium phlei]